MGFFLTGSGAPPTVLDLGLWAGALPPSTYAEPSDYNCSATIDVFDLGIWAGNLGLSCETTSCP
jgi:hypothetical protein